MSADGLNTTIVGGPPVPLAMSLECPGNQELFNQVQSAINCACASEGPNAGSLCRAVNAGNALSVPPFSCLINLLTGPYSQCGAVIPDELRVAAYNAFINVTGFQPLDLGAVVTNINGDQQRILDFNAFYIFIPIMIVLIIGIWLMVGFSWINWVAGIFLTVMVFVILYGASVLYRLHARNFINTNTQKVQNDIVNAQQNWQNSVAYLPQGLGAVACAVAGTGWMCNGAQCPPCNAATMSRTHCPGGICGNNAKVQDSEPSELEEELRPLSIRERRALLRKKNDRKH